MTNAYANGSSSPVGSSLPGPLRTLPDMGSSWADHIDLDFDTAADRIIRAHARDGEHKDLPVTDLKTWAIAPVDGKFALVPLARHHTPKPLRANGFSNLAARLGAPADFVRKLPAPLQLATLNYLLAEHDDNSGATLRLRNDEVSAIVSGRYAPLDPVELMETIRGALAKYGILHDVRVRSLACGVTDNVRIVLPSDEVALRPGDTTSVGIDITSSSFGRASAAVTPITWRLICSNGARRLERGAGLIYRHVGDRHRLQEAVRSAVPEAIARARGFVDQWRKSVSFMVEGVQRQIDAMRELSVPEKKNLETALLHETGRPALPEHVPLYDLVNAMTASAKEASPARRLDIESLAGDVLARHVGRA